MIASHSAGPVESLVLGSVAVVVLGSVGSVALVAVEPVDSVPAVEPTDVLVAETVPVVDGSSLAFVVSAPESPHAVARLANPSVSVCAKELRRRLRLQLDCAG